ncbi:anthocyanidin reductase ((2S)-flavan-3-ol-forming) [Zea mays]|uniref:anthocyanidin reductase ((2S)-flavan-3-ol-forming) n=1 Tax=Zea mays TaxID=4577 RepID=UPI0009A96F4B|nr:anthocyanidin reductase ((2S)-flavan-3-ol-forming)-like [Zea mays]|eukprot:XP_020395632.1 anthocyanidin reductase ((2S)-flavan-3-ol-forming)-like [Zea mays]
MRPNDGAAHSAAHPTVPAFYTSKPTSLQAPGGTRCPRCCIGLVTVCPGLTVVGAAPAPTTRTSVPNYLSLLSGDKAAFAVLDAVESATGCLPLVHIDDVCRTELFAVEEGAAAGRYVCCGLNTTIAELARFLADKYPQYGVKTNLSGERLEKPRVCLSSAKLVKEGFIL